MWNFVTTSNVAGEAHSVMSTLIAGPDLIEFGWTVSTWVPAVRKLSRNYDKTVIICRTGNDYLYQDFASKIEHYDKKGRSDRWLFEGKKVPIIQQIIGRYPGARVITPNEEWCCKAKREYFAYGEPGKGEEFDIVIHARAETKYGQHKFNWPIKNYEALLDSLGNPRVACIGTVADYIPRTADKRGIQLKQLCDLLASSKLCIGPSSGTMHLAHLCRCSIVVWTGKEYQNVISGTNRYRYEKKWRAFKDVSVKVVDREGWRPSVHAIAKAIKS